MLINLLSILLLISLADDFKNGLAYGIEQPTWIVIGAFATLSLNLILFYFIPKGKISIDKNSFIHKISTDKKLKKVALVILWTFTTFVFVGAFNRSSTIRYNTNYLGALLLSIVTAAILSQKPKFD